MNMYVLDEVDLPDGYERCDGLMVIANDLDEARTLIDNCRLKGARIRLIETVSLVGNDIEPRVLAFGDLKEWWKWNE